MANEELLQIAAPHFCAGVVVIADRVVESAPILRWSIGKRRDELARYCKHKGWTIQEVTPNVD